MIPGTIIFEHQKAELEAVLASGIFVRSSRQAKILEYVCHEYFSGRAHQIKEYNLATEVLGRPADFDQSTDAIVRVEVFRLRKKLKEYYETEGAGHAFHIVIDSGQYVPRFIPRGEPNAVEPANGAGSIEGDVSPLSERGRNGRTGLGISLPERVFGRYLWIILTATILLAIAVFLVIPKPLFIGTRARARSVSPAATELMAPASGVRILAGHLKGSYIDREGNVWQGDRYFTGGDALAMPRQYIARTLDPAMFQSFRSGEFSYDIPLKPGNYEMRLFFAETHYGPDTLSGGGETSRLFDVNMNGKPLLHLFDIIKDAGGNNVADVRVFKDVQPAGDGRLHLKFEPLIDAPILTAIELEPAPPGRINPIRIVAQPNSYTAHDGSVWEHDRYASGGQFATHLHRTQVSGTPDPDLYVGERFGHFNYAIPVPPGKYAVTLHFAETYWGTDNQRPTALPDAGGSPQGGAGSRIFDVYFNGRTLLKNFDIFKEAGGASRALNETFHGLEPDAQGKLILSFVPVRDYACINAIEVEDESR
jgi:Malectin domain